MAVQPVDNNTTNTTENTPETTRIHISYEKLKALTAAEIIDGYNNQNWSVPKDVLTWAEQEVNTNPNSKTTYGDAVSSGSTESDAVAYQMALEESGMSLKEQCKEFTSISKGKEERDLANISGMAPFAQDILNDETGGDNGESEVSKALKEINKEMMKDFRSFNFNDFKEGQKFFNAFKKGTKDTVEEYEYSLEEIQSVLEGDLRDSKDSKQWGTKTVELGKELKSHTRFWQLFGSRRKVANKAIKQGNNTVEMADRSEKLATAIAKDNQISLHSVQNNLDAINNSSPGSNGGGSTDGGSSGGTSTGGSTGSGGSSSGGGSTVS